VRKRMYKDGFAPRQDGGDEVRDSRIDLAKISRLSRRQRSPELRRAFARGGVLTFRRCSVDKSDLLNWPEIVFTFPGRSRACKR
jgi:hypothetical protein